MRNNVLPTGLNLSLNLALGVNDPSLVCTIENILELASSRILETLLLFIETEEEVLDQEIEQLKEDAENQLGRRTFMRNLTQIKRNFGLEKQA